MILTLSAAGVRFVLLDIEGTTTPIEFVHGVLFPFARVRLPAYLEETPAADADFRAIIDRLRDEHRADAAAGLTPPAWHEDSPGAARASIAAYVYWLMDRDRKSPGLKALQGKIWELGYGAGELRGEVYPDVPAALERWTSAGVSIGIFSSGSVLAQKLLFAHSNAGDLSRFFRWHFDTAVGAKVDAGSYRRIAEETSDSPARMLFVSDVTKELDAAEAAGLQTAWCVRDAEQPSLKKQSDHPIVRSLEEIV